MKIITAYCTCGVGDIHEFLLRDAKMNGYTDMNTSFGTDGSAGAAREIQTSKVYVVNVPAAMSALPFPMPETATDGQWGINCKHERMYSSQ